MAQGSKRMRWARLLTMAAVLLGVGGALAALAAALGSQHGAWHFRAGFGVLRWALFAAMAGGVLALIGLFVARRVSRPLVWANFAALLVALGFVGFLGWQIATARSVPPIHEATTALDDPPQFRVLALREDHMETIPDQGRPELAALPPEERWKALHREAYGDLRPVRVPWGVAETVERAARVARRRGWEIAAVDPEGGHLEATATSLFFGFKDDVAVRVRPYPEVKGGSQVDVRSISRVGMSDVGANARRIRAFIRDLQRSGD